MNSPEPGTHEAELLLLPDGRILGHNLSAEVAALLSMLSPDDADMKQRACLAKQPLQP